MTSLARTPLLVVADDDAAERGRVVAELERRYGADYTVHGCTTAAASAVLEHAHDVAVVLAAGDDGIALLEGVRSRFPAARRGLLIPWLGWADPELGPSVLDAMARGWIDLYVLRPTGSPDEIFHRTVTELLQESARLKGEGPSGATVVADSRSPRARILRAALANLGIPHRIREAPAGSAPRIELADGMELDDPTEAELAHALGFPIALDKGEADVVVIGAGPAGLAAAVYAASEGLETVVLDRGAIGGQAGASSLIRNYLGFPRGLGGGELAQRAYQQAWLFGTRFLLTQRAETLERRGERLVVGTADGVEVSARAVVLALGVEYRRLEAPGLAELECLGVYYGAAVSEAQTLAGEEVYVVGGGNSAGQATLYLARYAKRVTVVVRGPDLAASMSRYLIETLEAAPNVDFLYSTEVVGASGDGRLEHVELQDASGAETIVPADALIVLIGAHPHTDWLPAEIERDEWGYVVAGPSLETTMPGVFAAGDVRARSVKRVAAAAGSGALAVSGVHAYLAREAEREWPARR